jgi:hypothetical protein
MSLLTFASVAVLFASQTTAHTLRRAVVPQVSGTPQVIGIANSSTWSRDSCTSTNVRGRELWTCRDSQSSSAFLSSTASWTNFTFDGSPDVVDGILNQYGSDSTGHAYFPVSEAQCGGNAGDCNNGTRYAIWPGTRPMPVDVGTNGSLSLYTWITNAYITMDCETLSENPSASLYRADYTPEVTGDDLPPATLVDNSFWPAGSIPYGTYGFVIKDDTAYLYGLLNGTSGIALAKVPADSVEDKTGYSYYTGSSWSSTPPDIMDSSAGIKNAGTGGQGNYHSSCFSLP